MEREHRGLDRRQIIKGAALAGVTAWTAPLIIDSLSSPAAAGSADKRWERQTNAPCVTGGTTSTGAGAGTSCTSCTPGMWTMAPNSTPTGWSGTPDGTGTAPVCGTQTTKSLASNNNCGSALRVNSQVFTIVSPCTFVDAVAIMFQRVNCGGTPNWFGNVGAATATINNAANPRTATFPAIADASTYYAIFRLVTTGSC